MVIDTCSQVRLSEAGVAVRVIEVAS